VLVCFRNRWKQLFYVSIFYFINVYIFALVGVQVLGGLTDRCYYKDETGLSVWVAGCGVVGWGGV